jgi:hypothetical protein
MAEDMIERVAKRLWDHSFDRMPDPPWEQTTELQKRFNRMLAREAIDAMREPTIGMLQRGYPAMIKANREQVYGEAIMDHGWRAMIDAALIHKQTGERE